MVYTSTPRGGTLTFAYYRGLDYFFWFKILNFTIFLGVNVLSTIFMGMSFSTGIFWGRQFKNVYFVVFLVYKVH